MAILDVTKTFAAQQILESEDLNNIVNDIETFFNTTRINDDNLQDLTLVTELIRDSSITLAKMGGDSIETSNIVNLNVTNSKLASGSVITSKILDVNVSADKMADSLVETAKLADAAVTNAKRSSVNYQLSASSGTFSTTAEAFTFNDISNFPEVTNLTATITTTGRPVMLMLVSDGSGNAAYLGAEPKFASSTEDFGPVIDIGIERDGTEIYLNEVILFTQRDIGVSWEKSMKLPPSMFKHFDDVSAGTYVYKIRAAAGDGSFAARVYYTKLLVMELE